MKIWNNEEEGGSGGGGQMTTILVGVSNWKEKASNESGKTGNFKRDGKFLSVDGEKGKRRRPRD